MKHSTRSHKKTSNFVPSGEEKAFIYQQAAELKMPVIVLMEKITGQTDHYTVTFVLDPDNLNLKVKGQGDNIFEACMRAKKTAKARFARTLDVSFADTERDFLIDLIKHKVQMH